MSQVLYQIWEAEQTDGIQRQQWQQQQQQQQHQIKSNQNGNNHRNDSKTLKTKPVLSKAWAELSPAQRTP